MISPVFDGTSLLQNVAMLPSYVAIAREAKGPLDLAEVEAYARGELLTDLVKGRAEEEAATRLADKVAALTGIDQAVSRRLAGRFDVDAFRRELDHNNGGVASRFDASVRGLHPYMDGGSLGFGDPSRDTLLAPLTSATGDLLSRKLNWRPDYELSNAAVWRAWDFGVSPPALFV
ncbi:hypothetical protein [Bradyrhizobium sp. CCGB12]|uniref:hypothetical protein n=1 Tax=Bradyrhizobium sp. CCGB12 TaxID=2949632 RepID=UPI0035C23A1D